MSLLSEIGPAIGTALNASWEAVRPYKEAIAGLLIIVFGAAGAFFKSYLPTSRRAEEALNEAAARGGGPSLQRMHPDDRAQLGDLRDTLHELTRAARHLTGAIEDQSDACRRRGRRDEHDHGEGRPA